MPNLSPPEDNPSPKLTPKEVRDYCLGTEPEELVFTTSKVQEFYAGLVISRNGKPIVWLDRLFGPYDAAEATSAALAERLKDRHAIVEGIVLIPVQVSLPDIPTHFNLHRISGTAEVTIQQSSFPLVIPPKKTARKPRKPKARAPKVTGKPT